MKTNLYRRCESEGVGISVMKAFSGGQLLNAKTSPFGKALTEYQCIQYALDKPGVITVPPEVRSCQDLRRILGFTDALPKEKDYSILGTFAPQEAEGSCVYCNHCQPCPAGLDVGLINKYYDLALTGDDLAKYHYASLNKKAKDVYNVDTVIPVVRSMLAKWRGWKRSESILENDSAFHSPKGRNLLCVPSLCARCLLPFPE